MNKRYDENRAVKKSYAEKIIADLKDLSKQFSSDINKLKARKKKAPKDAELPIDIQIEFLEELRNYAKEHITLNKEHFINPPKKEKAKKR